MYTIDLQLSRNAMIPAVDSNMSGYGTLPKSMLQLMYKVCSKLLI